WPFSRKGGWPSTPRERIWSRMKCSGSTCCTPSQRDDPREAACRGGPVSFARRALIVLWKDVLVERRTKEALNALVFFSLLLLFVFQFALGPDRDRLTAMLPGLLWLAFVLSGLLALGRSFLIEREND